MNAMITQTIELTCYGFAPTGDEHADDSASSIVGVCW
jgi:hypothetical protein